jgi:hypothetical protein
MFKKWLKLFFSFPLSGWFVEGFAFLYPPSLCVFRARPRKEKVAFFIQKKKGELEIFKCMKIEKCCCQH